MRSKKTQVSLFIIVGIIILTVVLLMYILMGSVEPQPTKDFEKLFKVNSENYVYIVTSLDTGLKKALVLAGHQAGSIYKTQAPGTRNFLGPGNGFQYGEFVLPFDLHGQRQNVSFALTAPVLGSTYHPDVPVYPYGPVELVHNPRMISDSYVNPFGNFPRVPLIPLCDYHGENSRLYSEAVACETYDSTDAGDSDSVQEYLEKYIEHFMQENIRIQDMPNLAKFNVTLEKPVCNVTIGDTSVHAVLKMPVILMKQGQQTSHSEFFTADVDVRLKKIHELVSHLSTRDSNDIFFNIARDAPTLNDCLDINGGNDVCLKQGMSVQKFSNVCLDKGLCDTGFYDDILMVTDKEYKINGEDYVFLAAIENRKPALDRIRQNTGDFDIVVKAGEQITIEPKGYDPDEDMHNENYYMAGLYHYYGWKQDYDDYFFCEFPPCAQDDEKYIRHITKIMLEWSHSPEYLTTRSSAQITTGPEDIGVHEVRVEVCDEADLCDFQVLKIFVYNESHNKPVADAIETIVKTTDSDAVVQTEPLIPPSPVDPSNPSDPSDPTEPAVDGLCNIFKCTEGEGQPFTDGTGPYKCNSACENPSVSVDCECDVSCGAQCATDFGWQGTICRSGCADCMFSEVASTTCSAPLDTTCTTVVIGSETYLVCPEGTGDIKQGAYVSFCKRNDVCQTSTCNEAGAENQAGEPCPSVGSILHIGTETFCFYNTGGTTTCGYDGRCNKKDLWNHNCDPDSGHCYRGGTCYFNVACDPDTGWSYTQDTNIVLDVLTQCTAAGCDNGYSERDKCYFGIECTQSGWSYQGSEDCSAMIVDEYCAYNGYCTKTGCDYADTDSLVCPVGKTARCTVTGTVCE